MLQRSDVVEGIYLKQIRERCATPARLSDAIPAGLICVVHKVGTDWTGEWAFQLRYLNPPSGTRTRPATQWSLNLREKDLGDFELIGNWLSAQALLESTPRPVKPKKGLKLSSKHHPAWMRKWHPNQLRLFEDF